MPITWPIALLARLGAQHVARLDVISRFEALLATSALITAVIRLAGPCAGDGAEHELRDLRQRARRRDAGGAVLLAAISASTMIRRDRGEPEHPVHAEPVVRHPHAEGADDRDADP